MWVRIKRVAGVADFMANKISDVDNIVYRVRPIDKSLFFNHAGDSVIVTPDIVTAE
jgi:hypothetical protein